MKKILLLGFVFTLFANTSVIAQNCFKFFPAKKGLKLEYTDYDKKGKEESKSVRTVVDKKTENGKQIIDYKIEITPVDADTTIVRNFQVECENGVVYVNLGSLINEDQFSKPGMELKVTGANVKMPNNPKVGQKLDGGDVTMEIVNDGTTMMTITSKISNRRVDAVEKLTTPAGTFNTFKIAYDIETNMGFIKSKSSAAEWYTEKYGLVKSETYDKRGKIQSSSVLTKIY